ncbi:MAG: hypothetical protein IPO07_03720 [Haliscomenobacter sp.]|nr:hypothetical protein [Haliscomenobacter sp.]MBK9487988.1 hypothetical protein [Haliscomenobacter sp.]
MIWLRQIFITATARRRDGLALRAFVGFASFCKSDRMAKRIERTDENGFFAYGDKGRRRAKIRFHPFHPFFNPVALRRRRESAKRVLAFGVVITLKPSGEAAYSQAFRSQTSPLNQNNLTRWVNFQIC